MVNVQVDDLVIRKCEEKDSDAVYELYKEATFDVLSKEKFDFIFNILFLDKYAYVVENVEGDIIGYIRSSFSKEGSEIEIRMNESISSELQLKLASSVVAYGNLPLSKSAVCRLAINE